MTIKPAWRFSVPRAGLPDGTVFRFPSAEKSQNIAGYSHFTSCKHITSAALISRVFIEVPLGLLVQADVGLGAVSYEKWVW